MRILSEKEKEFILDAVFPEMTKISEAPSPAPEGDTDKEYKAIDSFGNIYSVQNPASRRYIIKGGLRYVIHRPKRLIMSYKDAISESRKTPVAENTDWNVNI